MKQFFLLSLVCLSLFATAQNVGIGTSAPDTKLDVAGAISVSVTSAAAAAAVTIPDNVSAFRLTNVAGGVTTVLTLATPQEGQYLTIVNLDDNDATFLGNTIAAGGGVYQFQFIGGTWRSTNGADGATGATGPAGPQGPVGAVGATGGTGAVGPQGPAGPAGANGNNGIDGINGTNGTNGANGATGGTGPVGPQGPAGAVGPQGPQGNVGPQGPVGLTGAAGPQGAQGIQGIQGPVGAVGPQGPVGLTGAAGPQGATGLLSAGTAAGNTTYWNGSTWVLNSSNIFNNGGAVGVGTASPAARFHVAGGGQILGTNGTTSATRTLTLLEDGDAQTNYGTYPGAWTSALQIQDNTTSRFLWMSPLDNASANNARLMAAGTGLDIYVNGAAASAGTLGLTVAASGNVGVGTASPGYKLHVPSGYIGTDYINTTDNVVSTGVSGIVVKAGDGYHRTGNAAAVLAYLGVTAPTGDNLGNHTATATLQMAGNNINNVNDIYAIQNFGTGLLGVYSATRYQNVWGMGTSWRLATDGTTPGNFYGLSWTHSNVGGQSKTGLSHQLLVMENGVTKVALGSGIWTNFTSYLPFIYDTDNNGYYLDPNSSSNVNVFTGNDFYSNGWFRNNNVNTGLYNQATGRHFYSESNSYWTAASANGMIFRNGHAGTITGYTYWDGTAGSNNFGLLSPNGNWRFRADNSNTEAYGSGFYAPTSYIGFIYDRDNTGYYCDPNSTSRMYYGDYNYLHTQTNDSWFPYTGNNYNYFRGQSYCWNAHWYDENNNGYYMNADNTTRLAYLYHGVGANNVGGWTSGRIQTESTSDGHQYNPVTGNWGYIGTSGQYWYYSYAGTHVNVSQRQLKRDITPLSESMYDYVMNDIDNIKPSFYKFNEETDDMQKGNEPKYRPNMRLGLILDESPDYIQDQAFSGIDIYAMATLGMAGVKYNRQDIQQLKEAVGVSKTKMTISDFGNETTTANETWVAFSEEFTAKNTSAAIPVVTVTSTVPGVMLSVTETQPGRFKVVSSSSATVPFNWIAMAKVLLPANAATEPVSSALLSQLKVDEAKKAPIKAYWDEQKRIGQTEHARQVEEHKRISDIGKKDYMETVNPESKKPAIGNNTNVPEDAAKKNLGDPNPSKEGAPKMHNLAPTPTPVPASETGPVRP